MCAILYIYLLIQLCLLLNSRLCAENRNNADCAAPFPGGKYVKEDEIVAACKVAQVVPSWQVACGMGGAGLLAGCLVSCFSRSVCVACLLGSQGKRKTFACLPLACAAGQERGQGRERGRRNRNTCSNACCFSFLLRSQRFCRVSFYAIYLADDDSLFYCLPVQTQAYTHTHTHSHTHTHTHTHSPRAQT